MRSICRATIAAAVVIGLWMAVPSPAGATANFHLDGVSPSTSLVEGQSVTVTGSGWPPSTQVFLTGFWVGPTGPSSTIIGGSHGQGLSDSQGRFTITVEIVRDVGSHDCARLDATGGGSCGLLGVAGDYPSTNQLAISFAPK